MSKGPQFERDFCTLLSEWFTRGKRDDVFWRSANSGGRATIRGRRGKRTSGQYGDVAAIDPIGRKLLEVVTIELKRGYTKSTILDLVEMIPSNGRQDWEDFFAQTLTAARVAKSKTWMLVSRRDKRLPMVWIERGFFDGLRQTDPWFEPFPVATLEIMVRPDKKKLLTKNTYLSVAGFPLAYLWKYDPKTFVRVGKRF